MKWDNSHLTTEEKLDFALKQYKKCSEMNRKLWKALEHAGEVYYFDVENMIKASEER